MLCREDGGVLDDLFTYRLAELEYLTVTNAANHERDLAWLAEHAPGYDVDVLDCADKFAMLAVQGPAARGIVASWPTASCRRACTPSERMVAGVPATVCGTGYTGEDGVELLLDPAEAVRSGTRSRRRRRAGRARGARHPAPGGLLSPLRQRSVAGARTDRSRPGLVLQGGDGLHRLRVDRGRAPRRPRTALVPFVIDGAGIARQGNPVIGGGEVTSGTFSPCLERGIGMAYVPAAQARAGHANRDRRARTVRPATVERKPLYRKAN